MVFKTMVFSVQTPSPLSISPIGFVSVNTFGVLTANSKRESGKRRRICQVRRQISCTARSVTQRRVNAPPISPVRVALEIQYDGTHYHGWERKPGISTVQSSVEQALSNIYGTEILVQAASRTDAGTHALRQVIHYDAPFSLHSSRALCKSINKRLPSSIIINRAGKTVSTFDARKNATGRTYRYTICDRPRSVFSQTYAWHISCNAPLNIENMNAAARVLWHEQKELDLRAFRRSNAQATHTIIHVRNVTVKREGDFIHIDVNANWFVYGMMRLLAASLVKVGKGGWSINEFQRIVKEGDRSNVLQGAPAKGLCLLSVEYDQKDDPFIDGSNNNKDQLSEIDIIHPWYS